MRRTQTQLANVPSTKKRHGIAEYQPSYGTNETDEDMEEMDEQQQENMNALYQNPFQYVSNQPRISLH